MIRRLLAALALLSVLGLLLPSGLMAKPEYSERTSEGCMACHEEPGEGRLNIDGLKCAASGYVWPPAGGYRVLGPIRSGVRFLVGYLHIVSAFIWFGTILYVHILLRPAYASKGLPRAEVVMGLISMGVVGISGLLFTISKVNSIRVLYTTSWGCWLSAKIAIYLFMISMAAFAVFFIGPRLKRSRREPEIPTSGVFDSLTLSAFDGKEGKEGI